MTHDWSQTARDFAQEMGRYRRAVDRGAVAFRFIDEVTLMPRTVMDGPLVIGIFGNDCDDVLGDDACEREIDEVRERLRGEEVREVGFGVSDDRGTWALLYAGDQDRYETVAGREVQKELLRLFLEDVVWSAWRAVLESHMTERSST
jgi:hypothetical protein